MKRRDLWLKAILFIADGMADRPVKELDWKTPLEAARRPSLNCIAKDGVCGIIDIISPGTPPGSDVATLALLGYDALKVYSGRGALEALGSGMRISPGEIAFRCNFATTSQKSIVVDRRAGRIANEDAAKLANELNEIRFKRSKVEFLFKSTIQHRAVLTLRGPKLSTAISDSDPGKTGMRALEVKPLDGSIAAKSTAKVVNELLQEFEKALRNHPVNQERKKQRLPPANTVLCRGAGTLPNVKPLSEIYGIEAACVAAAPLVKGVCAVAGMKVLEVKGATGTPQTNYSGKAKAAVKALKTSDLVVLHVKAADVAGHDMKPKQKVEIIEKIDGMLGCMLKDVDLDSTYVAATADHTTSVLTGDHEGDPVPVAIIGPYVRRDDVTEYGERSCCMGGLHRLRGVDLMPTLMNFLGRMNKFGA